VPALVLMLGVATGTSDRFVQAELLGLHAGATVGAQPPTTWDRAAVLKATLVYDRLRVGITAIDINQFEFGLGGAQALAPIHVGFNLLARPVKRASFHGFAPACYVEAAVGYAYFGGTSLYTRLTAAYETDWLGVGIGAEAGAVGLFGSDVLQYSNEPRLYAALKLRLLTAAFRV
jgi:hypothetical protein